MTAPTWTQQELSLPPVRGLIPLHNRKGLPYRFVDLQRWIRLTRLYHKSQKIDLLHLGDFRPDLSEIISAADSAGLDVALSIRTDCDAPPPPALAGWNLWDAFLCPPGLNSAHLDAWLRVCREAELSVRLQLPMGAAAENAPDALASQFAEHGVRSVFFALADPFTALPRQHLDASTVHLLLQTADALEARQIETHFLHVPFCQVPPERFPNITNAAQYFRSPQCYTALSYRLAEQVYRRHPAIAARIIQVRLGEFMSYDNPLDRGIQKWLLESHQRIYEKVLAGRKLLRYVPWERPGTVLETEEALDAAVAAARHARDERMHKECRRCHLRYICDRDTAVFRHSFPSARLEAQEGELCLSPAQFARQQWVCLDPIDAARRDSARSREALADDARRVMGSVPPTGSSTPRMITRR